MAMDQSLLKDVDVCIMNSLTETHTVSPDAMLKEFCSNLGKFLLFFFKKRKTLNYISLNCEKSLGKKKYYSMLLPHGSILGYN